MNYSGVQASCHNILAGLAMSCVIALMIKAHDYPIYFFVLPVFCAVDRMLLVGGLVARPHVPYFHNYETASNSIILKLE
jgi:hypothetical protein